MRPRWGVEPDRAPPPREVQPWTRVLGHVVVRGDRPFCSCGWPGEAERAQTIEEHLRSAWPELLPREPGEMRENWRQRVAAAHEAAIEERERIWDEHDMGNSIPPGSEFPLIPEEWARADERVQVLEYRLEQFTDEPR